MTKRIAIIISGILSPYLIAPLAATISILAYAPTSGEVVVWAAVIFGLAFFPSAIDLFAGYRYKRIPDLRLLDKADRRELYVVTTISITLSAIVLAGIDAAPEVITVSAASALICATLGVVNQFTKVSLHTATITWAASMLGFAVNPIFFVALTLVPIVGWARIFRGRHTLIQVALGAFIAFGASALVWWSAHFLTGS